VARLAADDIFGIGKSTVIPIDLNRPDPGIVPKANRSFASDLTISAGK
jgi:hypothetical protein